MANLNLSPDPKIKITTNGVDTLYLEFNGGEPPWTYSETDGGPQTTYEKGTSIEVTATATVYVTDATDTTIFSAGEVIQIVPAGSVFTGARSPLTDGRTSFDLRNFDAQQDDEYHVLMDNAKLVVVQQAAYGGLQRGEQDQSQAYVVNAHLQHAINQNCGVVTLDNSIMGGAPTDPDDPDVVQNRFGAVVRIGQEIQAFAGLQGDTINFTQWQTPSNPPPQTTPATPLQVKVLGASYGAKASSDPSSTQAWNVTDRLQAQLNEQYTRNQNSVITINNTTMGGDPSVGNSKRFGAVVSDVDGSNVRAYACVESQTIDFSTSATPYETQQPLGSS